MGKSKIVRLMLLGSIGSSLIGLPYVCQLFAVDNDVMQWGILSVFIGLLLLCSTVALDNLKNKTAKYLLCVEFAFLSILQLVPIYYWLVARTQVITVSTFSKVVNNVGFTVPHFILLFIGILVIYNLLYKDFIPNLNEG